MGRDVGERRRGEMGCDSPFFLDSPPRPAPPRPAPKFYASQLSLWRPEGHGLWVTYSRGSCSPLPPLPPLHPLRKLLMVCLVPFPCTPSVPVCVCVCLALGDWCKFPLWFSFFFLFPLAWPRVFSFNSCTLSSREITTSFSFYCRIHFLRPLLSIMFYFPFPKLLASCNPLIKWLKASWLIVVFSFPPSSSPAVPCPSPQAPGNSSSVGPRQFVMCDKNTLIPIKCTLLFHIPHGYMLFQRACMNICIVASMGKKNIHTYI